MIIIKILGGFASQLGKYTFGYNIAKSRNDELVLDISDYINGYFRPFMLEYITLPNVRVVNGVKEFKNVITVRNGKELLKAYNKENSIIYITNEEGDYKEFTNLYDDMLISPNSEILKNLSLKKDSEFIKKYYKLFTNPNSVSIHVRRGDFINLGWSNNDSQIYKDTIGYFLNKNPNSKFIFFSNDIEWVKNEFGKQDNFYYMENNNGNIGDLEDFFCMSLCKNKILNSISGYSVYANYLGICKYKSNKAIVLSTNTNFSLKNFTKLNNDDLINGKVYYEEFVNDGIKSKNYNLLINDHPAVQKQDQKTIKDKKKFIVISTEAYDRWRKNGMNALAYCLSKKHEVVYLNINPFSWQQLPEQTLFDEFDMDKKEYLYKFLYLPKTRINKKILHGFIENIDDYIIVSDFFLFVDNYYYISNITNNIWKIIWNLFFWNQKGINKKLLINYDSKIPFGFLDEIANENDISNYSKIPFQSLIEKHFD